ncbi:hypothetical protein [Methylocystis suflitae]|uniref:hypothetical protein n=1 Tax=Methylocystis suflitae TaxID=2951405 RepID=UPI00210C93EE|nr:hypothetical protein [Methylocystis suflitae]MCQ4188514.1 hypothetical protein [Methylocystis suflitae]
MSIERDQPKLEPATDASSSAEERSLYLAEEINKAFPDFRCLRCSNDKFFFTGSYLSGQLTIKKNGRYASNLGDAVETIALVCQRCGFVEQHAVDIFFDAKKPIGDSK